MPRQLLRDGLVVDDDWQYWTDANSGADASAPAVQSGAAKNFPTILTFAEWQASRDRWRSSASRLGVVLLPEHKVETLEPDLAAFELVAIQFSGPGEGRGYTQGRLLRERYGFAGELRAMGYVRRDQLFFLARCGFTSFELPQNELQQALSAFATFSAEYQRSNDLGLGHSLRHR